MEDGLLGVNGCCVLLHVACLVSEVEKEHAFTQGLRMGGRTVRDQTMKQSHAILLHVNVRHTAIPCMVVTF